MYEKGWCKELQVCDGEKKCSEVCGFKYSQVRFK